MNSAPHGTSWGTPHCVMECAQISFMTKGDITRWAATSISQGWRNSWRSTPRWISWRMTPWPMLATSSWKKRDFGEVAGFCDDQLDDAADMRLAEAVPPVGEHVGEQLFVAAGGLLDALPELLDDRHDVDPHHGLEEIFLAGVIEIEGTLGYTGTRRHVVEAGGRVTPGHENFQRGIQQFAGPVLLAALPGTGAFAFFCGLGGRVHHMY